MADVTKRCAGEIEYTLHYKNVKNINLRIKSDLSVYVSANKRIPTSIIDSFVLSKSDFIIKAKIRISSCEDEENLNKVTTDQLADLKNFCIEYSDKTYDTLFSDRFKKPQIFFKEMKSAWGICHPKRGYITLNTRLAQYDRKAVEYVIMHEFVHLIHPNHQKGFHNEMKVLMPDYNERKKLLKQRRINNA